MMAGNPSNWWSMHSNLRSSSSSSSASEHHHHHHHHHHHQHDEAEVVPTNNLLISQTHPSNSLFPPLQFLHGHGGGGGGGGGSSSSSCAVSSSSSPSLLPFITPAGDPHGQDFPHSWSQLLLGGLGNEQDHHHHHHQERFSSSPSEFDTRAMNDVVKQEVNISSHQSNNNNNNNLLQLYGNQFHEEQQDNNNQVSLGVSNDNRGAAAAAAAWTHHHQIMSASLSPKSCITSLNSSSNTTTNNNNRSSSNMLDFSTNTNNKRSLQSENHQHAELTTNSECNSTATTGGVLPKKPRVQSSSNPPLKVRKEKLGDRITALHQLVSPFGKTDTASVLLEAIGYIRFLQGQIEALSSPYIGNNNASAKNQYSVNGERNCLFPDHPGQLLNDSCLKRRRAANQEDNKDAITKDLKSRGLCLVPTSCTQLVGSDNGADYWAQSLGGGGF